MFPGAFKCLQPTELSIPPLRAVRNSCVEHLRKFNLRKLQRQSLSFGDLYGVKDIEFKIMLLTAASAM